MYEGEGSGGDTKLGDQLRDLGDQLGDLGDQLGDLGDQLSDLGDQLSDLGDQLGDLGNQLGDVRFRKCTNDITTLSSLSTSCERMSIAQVMTLINTPSVVLGSFLIGQDMNGPSIIATVAEQDLVLCHLHGLLVLLLNSVHP